MRIWTEAVTKAIRRHVARTGSPLFTRRALEAAELGAMSAETRTTGRTPGQTVGRELQQLRDAGLLDFVKRGTYRWLGEMAEAEPATPSRGVFVLPARPDTAETPERSYLLPARWLRRAMRLSGQWIVYQMPQPGGDGDYLAVARVETIDAEGLVARIAEGSYLEFGRPVPFRQDDLPVERGLLDVDGRLDGDRAACPVRAISDADFNRIVELGLVTEEDLLPRIDSDGMSCPRRCSSRNGALGRLRSIARRCSSTARSATASSASAFSTLTGRAARSLA